MFGNLLMAVYKVEEKSIISSPDPFGDGSLIAKYELDGDATDTTETYDGTPNGVTYGTGLFSQSAVFSNALSNIVSTASSVKSISMFIKKDSAVSQLDGGSIVDARHISGTGYLFSSNGIFTFSGSTLEVEGVSVSSGQSYSSDIWIHLYMEYATPQTNFLIGGQTSSTYGFGGSIDQFEMYDRDLTEEEKTQLRAQ